MTEVNHAEIKSPVLRQDGAARWEQIARDLPSLPIESHPPDRELADLAADFKSRVSLSLADAFPTALAKRHKAELVTGDPEFKAGKGSTHSMGCFPPQERPMLWVDPFL
jgi:predicted nucleic acid-binding protein